MSFVTQLSHMGIQVHLVAENQIRLSCVDGITKSAVDLARVHKQEIIGELLYQRSVCTHTPPDLFANRIDKPDPSRVNWVRSHCRKCGRFLGYREVGR